MKKYQDKYRIPFARHPDWDYSSNGSYYVTICTAMRKCFFGEIKDGEMYFSEIGRTKKYDKWNIRISFYLSVQYDKITSLENHPSLNIF